MIGQPSDPGCSAQADQVDCVGLSIGCRWDGVNCSFKACHLQDSEGTCQAQGCVWEGSTCYFADCSQLNAATCQSAYGCSYWMNRFVECSGTYSCSELDPSAAPGMPSAQALCEAAGMGGLACSWAP